MKLFRNLIYILSGLLVIGIILVILVCPSSVMSRIATGLTTGAFVGLISAVVNYVHVRNSYLENLSMTLFRIKHALLGDLFDAEDRNKLLSEKTKKEIIEYYKGRSDEEDAAVNAMKSMYSELADQIDCDSFIGILPWEKDVSRILKENDIFIHNNVACLYWSLEHCLNFSQLSIKDPRDRRNSLQPLTYELLVEKNKELQDIIYDTLVKFSKLVSDILSVCDSKLPLSTNRILMRIIQDSRKGIDKHILYLTLEGDMSNLHENDELNDGITSTETKCQQND